MFNQPLFLWKLHQPHDFMLFNTPGGLKPSNRLPKLQGLLESVEVLRVLLRSPPLGDHSLERERERQAALLSRCMAPVMSNVRRNLGTTWTNSESGWKSSQVKVTWEFWWFHESRFYLSPCHLFLCLGCMIVSQNHKLREIGEPNIYHLSFINVWPSKIDCFLVILATYIMYKIKIDIINWPKNLAFCFPSNMFLERFLWVLDPGGSFKPSEKGQIGQIISPLTPNRGATLQKETLSYLRIDTSLKHVSQFHLSFCLKPVLGGLPLISRRHLSHETSLSHNFQRRVLESELVILKLNIFQSTFLFQIMFALLFLHLCDNILGHIMSFASSVLCKNKNSPQN